MKISISLDTTRKQSKGYAVKVTVSHKGRKRATISHSQIKDWDVRKSLPKKSHPNYINLVKLIYDINAKTLEVDVVIGVSRWTTQKVLNFILTGEENDQVEFYEFADSVIEQLKKEQRFGTSNKYFHGLNQLKKIHKPPLYFSDITPNTWEVFCAMKRQDAGANSINGYMRTFRAIYYRHDYNPKIFKGVIPKLVETRPKEITREEMRLLRDLPVERKHEYSNVYNFKNYCLLLFYLGGIDLIDLRNLRYDKHVEHGRLIFNRFKGGTDALIRQVIPKEALDILKQYDCAPYLVPIYKVTNYDNFRSDMIGRLKLAVKSEGIESNLTTKSMRYTYINLARDLGIDRSITEQIVGHVSQKTHSIYEGKHPQKLIDETHLRIIASLK